MTDLDANAAVHALTAPLRRAQIIHIVRGLVLAVLWAAAAGLFAYRLIPVLAQLAGREADPLSSGFFVFAPVLVVGLSLAFGNPPTLLTLARRADGIYQGGERLTTALEQPPRASGPASAILAGLYRDTAAYAARIVPSQLVQPFGAPVLASIGALVAAIAVFALVSVPSPAPSAPAISAAPVQTVDSAVRAQNVEALADILSEDADQRSNDFLKKVADAVGQLAQRQDLSPEAYRNELTGLLDNARLAYGRTPPNWLLFNATKPDNRYGLADDRNFSALAQRAAEANAPDPRAGSGEELVPELLSEQNLQHAPVPAPLPGQLTIAPEDNADLALNSSNVGGRNAADTLEGQAKAGAPGGQAPSLGNEGGAVDVDGASARLVGGATQSGQGASRTAGLGTQDLADPNRADAAPLPPEQEEVLLPPGEYTKGKRIRMQVAPATADANSTSSPGGLKAAQPGATTPTPVNRDLPSVRDQAVFSRFFTHGEDGGV